MAKKKNIADKLSVKVPNACIWFAWALAIDANWCHACCTAKQQFDKSVQKMVNTVLVKGIAAPTRV